MRYFRSTRAVYAAICAQLDAAYGYPNEQTKTFRSLPAIEELPVDGQGLVYLAISAEYCDYVLPSELLPELLASGAVEEIDEAAYRSAVPISGLPT